MLDGGDAAEGDAEDERAEEGPDFNYLVGMTMWNLSKEKKDELLKQRDAKLEEKRLLQEKMPRQLWRDDLEAFLVELDVSTKTISDDSTYVVVSYLICYLRSGFFLYPCKCV